MGLVALQKEQKQKEKRIDNWNERAKKKEKIKDWKAEKNRNRNGNKNKNKEYQARILNGLEFGFDSRVNWWCIVANNIIFGWFGIENEVVV